MSYKKKFKIWLIFLMYVNIDYKISLKKIVFFSIRVIKKKLLNEIIYYILE